MKNASSLIRLGRSMALNPSKQADHVGCLVTVDDKIVHIAGSEGVAKRIAHILNFCRTGKLSHLLEASAIIINLEARADFSISKVSHNA